MGVVSKPLSLASAIARPPRDILPCVLPYPSAADVAVANLSGLSRSVRSRLKKSAGWRQWANQGVDSLNCLAAPGVELPKTSSAAQRVALKFVEEAYQAVGPPPCTSAAAAFQELCGSPPGYGSDVLAGRVSYKPGATALPPPHSAFAQGAELLHGADLDAWVNWQEVLLRTPAELATALHEERAPEILTHPALTRSPKRYAELLVRLEQRGLIR